MKQKNSHRCWFSEKTILIAVGLLLVGLALIETVTIVSTDLAPHWHRTKKGEVRVTYPQVGMVFCFTSVGAVCFWRAYSIHRRSKKPRQIGPTQAGKEPKCDGK